MRYHLFCLLLILACLPSCLVGEPQFKVRAMWVDTSELASAQAIDNVIAKSQKAGINVLLPLVMAHHGIFYKSSHYLYKSYATAQFDPLAYMIEKAHAAGIQVHAWYAVYYEGGTKSDHPEWLVADLDGKPISSPIFISPAHPDVNPYLLSVIKEVLAYDVDGIHLDYIRYPGTQYDYSEAARKRFKEIKGFDPIHFLDGEGKTISAAEDPFPIRVLRAKRHVERAWETSWNERLLDQAGVGFAFISEKPENIDAMRAPGLLVLSNYYDVPPEMLTAIRRYLDRGGNILWIDAPNEVVKSDELARILGFKGKKWLSGRLMSLKAEGKHPLAKLIPSEEFNTHANTPAGLNGATLIAKLDSGEPALTVNNWGKGKAVVLGVNAGSSGSIELAALVKQITGWLCYESKVPAGTDLLALKRAEWINWRADQVTWLVREVCKAAKAENPKIAVTSSGSPNPSEFYIVYRDARRWLIEGLNDYIFPMNYTSDVNDFIRIIDKQIAATPKGMENRIYPGLAIYDTRVIDGTKKVVSQDVNIVEKQLQVIRDKGYQGYCLFASLYLNDELMEMLQRYSR